MEDKYIITLEQYRQLSPDVEPEDFGLEPYLDEKTCKFRRIDLLSKQGYKLFVCSNCGKIHYCQGNPKVSLKTVKYCDGCGAKVVNL